MTCQSEPERKFWSSMYYYKCAETVKIRIHAYNQKYMYFWCNVLGCTLQSVELNSERTLTQLTCIDLFGSNNMCLTQHKT